MKDSANLEGFEITWNGGNCIDLVDGGFRIALDPYSSNVDGKPDIVLLVEKDENGLEALEKVEDERTVFLTPGVELPFRDVEPLKDCESLEIYGVQVTMLSAEESRTATYVLELEGMRIFVGDPEFDLSSSNVDPGFDLAFYSLENLETDTLRAAAVTAAKMRADTVVPVGESATVEDLDKKMQELRNELENRSIECLVLKNQST